MFLLIIKLKFLGVNVDILFGFEEVIFKKDIFVIFNV